MAGATTAPGMLPYRDSNGEIKYVAREAYSEATGITLKVSSRERKYSTGSGNNNSSGGGGGRLNILNRNNYDLIEYDSDSAPLMEAPGYASGEPQPNSNILSQDEVAHFTASGRPMPVFKSSSLFNLAAGDSMYIPPQLLPTRYTDESVIPAIITGVIPGDGGIDYPPPTTTTTTVTNDDFKTGMSVETTAILPPREEPSKPRRSSFIKKLKGGSSSSDKKKDQLITKVVYMPRGEYLKHFVKDSSGLYAGTEPFRRWTEAELDRTYAQYKPKREEKTGYRPPL